MSQLPSRPELPDPLVMLDGTRVKSREEWFQKRRPELRVLFSHYMYGQAPEAPPSIKAVVERTNPKAMGGTATQKEISITFGPPDAPKIHLLLMVPNKEGPVPIFLGLNTLGNHSTLKDPGIPLPTAWVPSPKDGKAREADRGAHGDVWPFDQIIARGYGLATFYAGDVAPDHPGFEDGVFPHYRPSGATTKADDDSWGVVRAWAWGLQRAVDYLVTDSSVDRERIAVVGHSRLGKAALVAAAYDDRIALALPHQAGCGGTAPSRGKVGESVKDINKHFPHWFDAHFKQFSGKPEYLPFDQHCLVALVAPRPVFFTNAVEDWWANPKGQFEVLKAADPVYRLLGGGGLESDTMPPVGQLLDGTLGYHIRPGKHSMFREDWVVFLDIADRHLRRANSSK
ncbi:acetylxylan esterase [Singulisphaera sp. PoT]|uniref:glucuronyl esterase domain-containing protein n=1 Tax=Singulisphaera sp. PoT TaxID=3411797 RepID=UPI003BF57EF9